MDFHNLEMSPHMDRAYAQAHPALLNRTLTSPLTQTGLHALWQSYISLPSVGFYWNATNRRQMCNRVAREKKVIQRQEKIPQKILKTQKAATRRKEQDKTDGQKVFHANLFITPKKNNIK